MNVKDQNLAELWHRFDTITSASDALAEMRAQAEGAGEWDLPWLLRDHAEEEIEDIDEISMRDAFDDLLAFFAVLRLRR
jgi:hypothetical protein